MTPHYRPTSQCRLHWARLADRFGISDIPSPDVRKGAKTPFSAFDGEYVEANETSERG
jgi:hypothetical protein